MSERLVEMGSTIVEELKKPERIEIYWGYGGKLDREGYNRAQFVLSEPNGQHCEVKKSSLGQAETMSRCSGVPITLSQKHLYAALRDLVPPKETPHPSLNPLSGVPAYILSDQQLMVEVFWFMNDVERVARFEHAYPHIFKQESAKPRV